MGTSQSKLNEVSHYQMGRVLLGTVVGVVKPLNAAFTTKVGPVGIEALENIHSNCKENLVEEDFVGDFVLFFGIAMARTLKPNPGMFTRDPGVKEALFQPLETALQDVEGDLSPMVRKHQKNWRNSCRSCMAPVVPGSKGTELDKTALQNREKALRAVLKDYVKDLSKDPAVLMDKAAAELKTFEEAVRQSILAAKNMENPGTRHLKNVAKQLKDFEKALLEPKPTPEPSSSQSRPAKEYMKTRDQTFANELTETGSTYEGSTSRQGESEGHGEDFDDTKSVDGIPGQARSVPTTPKSPKNKTSPSNASAASDDKEKKEPSPAAAAAAAKDKPKEKAKKGAKAKAKEKGKEDEKKVEEVAKAAEATKAAMAKPKVPKTRSKRSMSQPFSSVLEMSSGDLTAHQPSEALERRTSDAIQPGAPGSERRPSVSSVASSVASVPRKKSVSSMNLDGDDKSKKKTKEDSAAAQEAAAIDRRNSLRPRSSVNLGGASKSPRSSVSEPAGKDKSKDARKQSVSGPADKESKEKQKEEAELKDPAGQRDAVKSPDQPSSSPAVSASLALAQSNANINAQGPPASSASGSGSGEPEHPPVSGLSTASAVSEASEAESKTAKKKKKEPAKTPSKPERAKSARGSKKGAAAPLERTESASNKGRSSVSKARKPSTGVPSLAIPKAGEDSKGPSPRSPREEKKSPRSEAGKSEAQSSAPGSEYDFDYSSDDSDETLASTRRSSLALDEDGSALLASADVSRENSSMQLAGPAGDLGKAAIPRSRSVPASKAGARSRSQISKAPIKRSESTEKTKNRGRRASQDNEAVASVDEAKLRAAQGSALLAEPKGALAVPDVSPRPDGAMISPRRSATSNANTDVSYASIQGGVAAPQMQRINSQRLDFSRSSSKTDLDGDSKEDQGDWDTRSAYSTASYLRRSMSLPGKPRGASATQDDSFFESARVRMMRSASARGMVNDGRAKSSMTLELDSNADSSMMDDPILKQRMSVEDAQRRAVERVKSSKKKKKPRGPAPEVAVLKQLGIRQSSGPPRPLMRSGSKANINAINNGSKTARGMRPPSQWNLMGPATTRSERSDSTATNTQNEADAAAIAAEEARATGIRRAQGLLIGADSSSADSSNKKAAAVQQAVYIPEEEHILSLALGQHNSRADFLDIIAEWSMKAPGAVASSQLVSLLIISRRTEDLEADMLKEMGLSSASRVSIYAVDPQVQLSNIALFEGFLVLGFTNGAATMHERLDGSIVVQEFKSKRHSGNSPVTAMCQLDDRYFAVAARDVQVWEVLKTGGKVSGVQEVAFISRGSSQHSFKHISFISLESFAVAASDGLIQIYQTRQLHKDKAAKPFREIPGPQLVALYTGRMHIGRLRAMNASNKVIVAGFGREVGVFDRRSAKKHGAGALTAYELSKGIKSVAILETGTVVAGSKDGCILLWDPLVPSGRAREVKKCHPQSNFICKITHVLPVPGGFVSCCTLGMKYWPTA